jgi:serine/threonine protein kinase
MYSVLKGGGFVGLALPVVAEVTRQVAECLGLLDALGLVHCDLKPENILLDRCPYYC